MPSRAVVDLPGATPRGASDAPPGSFLRAFGGGLLGASIGGGLGWLIGPVAERELYPDCARSTRDCDGEVYLAPMGVLLGSTVGAIAGARADVDGAATLTAGFGSALGSLIGLAALATASNGRGLWSGIGFVAGAAAGAAFGATIAAPDVQARNGILHRRRGEWALRAPTIMTRPPVGAVQSPTVHVVLVSARW